MIIYGDLNISKLKGKWRELAQIVACMAGKAQPKGPVRVLTCLPN